MKFISELLKQIEGKNINFFEEKDLKRRLEEKGYIEKKQKNIKINRVEIYYEKEIKESVVEEVDFFSKDKLNRSLNKAGFKNDKDRKVWYRRKEGKEILADLYMDKLEDIGFKRYCNSTEDEYIDEPRDEIKGIYLPYGLIEELESIAIERGLEFSISLELILLEYLSKNKQLKSRHLNNIIKGLEEDSCDEDEIKYIKEKFKNSKDNISNEEIVNALDEFYLKFFKNIGFNKNEINTLKEIGESEIEFLGACYYAVKQNNKTTFQELRKFYENDFKETEEVILEKTITNMKDFGLTNEQIKYLITQNNKSIKEDFLELVVEYKLKTFEDIEEIYRNDFSITNNLFYKYLKEIGISENEADVLRGYILNRFNKDEEEQVIISRIFSWINDSNQVDFKTIEYWIREITREETEEEKKFNEQMKEINRKIQEHLIL